MPATRKYADTKMGHFHTRSHMGGKTKRAVRKVGFYGCNDRVVRVELRKLPEKGARYPLVIRLQCPACTHEHDAQPLWREYNPALDDGKEVVLL
jgi:ribosomal protein L44E